VRFVRSSSILSSPRIDRVSSSNSRLSGADAADPHGGVRSPGRAGEPIVVDVFPRSKATGYHADTTRTWVRGEPTETLAEWHRLTDEAREAALDAVEPGATGAAVHAAACDVYEDAHTIAPERTHHDEDQLELIAPEKLRDALALTDDDTVAVTVEDDDHGTPGREGDE